MELSKILKKLNKLSNPKNIEGMSRFGIRPKTKILGVPLNLLRPFSKEIKKDHSLALQLWKTNIHEARHLAAMIDIPEEVTEEQFNSWTEDFDSWDICDQCCSNLFDKTPFAWSKIIEFSKRNEEFVKRTAFTLMAALAVHDKKAEDAKFISFFPIIKREATDERNYVKKAVNWALRQIGKRNLNLNKEAIIVANEIKEMDSRAAKWIAADALRELTNKKVQNRLKNKNTEKSTN